MAQSFHTFIDRLKRGLVNKAIFMTRSPSRSSLKSLLVVDFIQGRDEGRVDFAASLLVEVDDLLGSLSNTLGLRIEIDMA